MMSATLKATFVEGVEAILAPYTLGSLELRNRVVMSPMTRGRTESEERAPGVLEAEYYAQRASAGLIITGGTYISRQSIGSIRVPGIYSVQQVEAWKRVTGAVHENGGRIFLQIAHSGSISHPDLHGCDLPVAPSAINPQQKVFTPTGFKDTVTPRSLDIDEIQAIVDDYGHAAKNARDGNSPEGRTRLVLDALESIANHWRKSQIGIKLSPGLNGVGAFVANDDTLPTYDYLFGKLKRFSPGYVHLMRPINDVSGTVVANLQEGTYKRYRPMFNGTLIANVGFDGKSANELIAGGDADLVSFARHYIANPDLPERFRQNVPLVEGDLATYYQGRAVGFTSYPPYEEREAAVTSR
jgi:N-ethylmaleimide reductase